MQAIHTKYMPATDYKPAKIKAYNRDHPRGVIVSIDQSLDRDLDQHFKAAREFIAKKIPYCNDQQTMTYGGSANGEGYVFCFTYAIVEAK